MSPRPPPSAPIHPLCCGGGDEMCGGWVVEVVDGDEWMVGGWCRDVWWSGGWLGWMVMSVWWCGDEMCGGGR